MLTAVEAEKGGTLQTRSSRPARLIERLYLFRGEKERKTKQSKKKVTKFLIVFERYYPEIQSGNLT